MQVRSFLRVEQESTRIDQPLVRVEAVLLYAAPVSCEATFVCLGHISDACQLSDIAYGMSRGYTVDIISTADHARR